MPVRKFSRKTKGFNAQVFVAKAIDVTTDATFKDFIANAPLGEMGVFDGNEALHTNAITSAEEFFFAIKTTEGVKRTPKYTLAELTKAKKTYQAPVRQVSAIGWNRTSGALNNAAIAAGQVWALKIMETTEGYDPFPKWNFEYYTKASDTSILDPLIKLAKQINDDAAPENKNNQRLVEARVVSNATYGAFVMTGTTPTITFTNGSKVATLGGTTPTIDAAVNDFLSIDASATPSDSVGDIYKVTAISAGVSITLDRPYIGTTIAMTEAQGEGTRLLKVTAPVAAGIELKAIEDDVHFRLAVSESLVDADISVVTPVTVSSGTYAKVLEMEAEGKIFAGETHNMVPQPEKWGQQDTFAVSGETYDIYSFNFLKSTQGIGVQAEYKSRASVVIAVAKSAGNFDTSLDTYFGF
jgi:hypothetical protein